MSNRLLAAYLTELGHPTTYEDSIRDYMGSAMHRVHDLVLERTGERLPADFDDVFHTRVFAAFERELKPVTGVVDVLAALSADGVPFCVASSGSHERIRVGHRTTGLDQWFDDERIFSSQDVGRGKPAPDLFLYAAERMGIALDQCLVIEDSPLGVQAAVAAGMEVYGFTAMTPAAKLTGASRLFAGMGELADLLS
ncbi:HAD family hydrolase [Streptomyces nodosus]|uniref:HAD family hydrolase n=1 Tax=Streptomyces nodosus TaxID=40318 RepID=A0A5P2W602_9ACTN|nr:HAD-IA family hydrolase [Streptomyces nodosus]QEV40392.1 HAD family hydrolase [Streptomyces nodosus]